MATMSRAIYLWYSLHIKLLSLIAMFFSLLFLVSKKNAALVPGADVAIGGATEQKNADPIIMAIALQ